MTDAVSAKQVAEYMLARLQKTKNLYQETVVYEIKKQFGKEFTYINDNGNLAIAKAVLAEFKKLSGDDVIWERGSRMWRLRKSYDKPGRQQD
jgi:hypothetical protein